MPVSNFRTIFSGYNPAIGLGENPKPGVAPTMNPVGLGYLAAGGYLPDIKNLFCPTAKRMPVDWTADVKNDAAISLKQIERAGGFSADRIIRDNWEHIGDWTRDHRYVSAKVVQSSYNYRLLPTLLYPGDSFGDIEKPETSEFAALYVTPRNVVKIGEPVFKTQRQLGGRAVISDSWSKNLGLGTATGPPEQPGNGYHAHREGYNVLYGDWSAKWYGDPEKRIMWWPAVHAGAPWYTNSFYGMTTNIVSDYWRPDPKNPDAPGIRAPAAGEGPRGAVGVWHIFDTLSGIDVDTDR